MSKHAAVIRNTAIAPYVGEGSDGCQRSAQIVRDELATLPAGDPRRDELEAQAQAWDERAERARVARCGGA